MPARITRAGTTLTAAAGLLGPACALAQTGQRLSVQASGLYANFYGANVDTLKAGPGVELQLRYTPGAISWGGGLQYTRHRDATAIRDGHESRINLVGVFLEPRYVIDINRARVAPYVSGRFAVTRQNARFRYTGGGSGSNDVLTYALTGVTLNGGGGVLARVTGRVNLDVGATLGYTRFGSGEATIVERTGPRSYDFQPRAVLNSVVRVGLAVGLGR